MVYSGLPRVQHVVMLFANLSTGQFAHKSWLLRDSIPVVHHARETLVRLATGEPKTQQYLLDASVLKIITSPLLKFVSTLQGALSNPLDKVYPSQINEDVANDPTSNRSDEYLNGNNSITVSIVATDDQVDRLELPHSPKNNSSDDRCSNDLRHTSSDLNGHNGSSRGVNIKSGSIPAFCLDVIGKCCLTIAGRKKLSEFFVAPSIPFPQVIGQVANMIACAEIINNKEFLDVALFILRQLAVYGYYNVWRETINCLVNHLSFRNEIFHVVCDSIINYAFCPLGAWELGSREDVLEYLKLLRVKFSSNQQVRLLTKVEASKQVFIISVCIGFQLS